MNVIERPLGVADRFQQRWPALAFPVAVWSKFNDDQAGNLAALIAYYAFAALFPLLLVLVTVLNIVLVNHPSVRNNLYNSALSQYPVIGPMIKANLGTIPGTGASLIIGTVLLLLGARGVAAAMQNSMYVIWGIPKDKRPGFPMSLVWALALMLTVGIGLVLTTVLSGLAGGTGHVITGAGAHVATVAVSLILNVCMFWLAFRIASGHQVPWRALRTGAAIAAVFWQFLQVSGGYIIGHQLHRASELYGTFGIVLGLLAWLYLQAEVTLYAAEADTVLALHLWPRSLLPAKPGQPGDEDQPAASGEPAPQARVERAGPEDGASLEEQPSHDGEADGSEEAPAPSPRDEPSDSDQRAAGQRSEGR